MHAEYTLQVVDSLYFEVRLDLAYFIMVALGSGLAPIVAVILLG